VDSESAIGGIASAIGFGIAFILYRMIKSLFRSREIEPPPALPQDELDALVEYPPTSEQPDGPRI